MVAFIWSLFFVHKNLSLVEATFIPPPRKVSEQWDPHLFKVLTFGHWPLAVNILWMRALQDQGLDHVQKGTHPPMYYDLLLAVQLDEAFFSAYTHGATFVSVGRDDGVGAKNLLEIAEYFRTHRLSDYPESFRKRFWSPEWLSAFFLGYVNLVDLHDLPAAAKAYLAAAEYPGLDEPFKKLARRLETIEGRFLVANRVVDMMLRNYKNNKKLVQKFQRKKFNLSVAYYLYQLNQAFQKFKGKSKKTSLKSFLKVSSLGNPFDLELYLDGDRIRAEGWTGNVMGLEY